MINGIGNLRQMYGQFDEDSYQPDGIDLKLGNVFKMNFNKHNLHGITNKEKILPELIPVSKTVEELGVGWVLQPNQEYILQVDRPIGIYKNSAQFYLPRSSLLRMGLNVITSLGDSGFKGTLSFLAKNETQHLLFLEEGVRFAQLIDFEVRNAGIYNGDYQEEVHEDINNFTNGHR